MTEPRTVAGKALLTHVDEFGVENAFANRDGMLASLLAIEREAAAPAGAGLAEALEWALDCLSADDDVPDLTKDQRWSVKHAISRDHKWTTECVDCMALTVVDQAVQAWPAHSTTYAESLNQARAALAANAGAAGPLGNGIDVERLQKAVWAVANDDRYLLEYAKEVARFADDIAAAYASAATAPEEGE